MGALQQNQISISSVGEAPLPFRNVALPPTTIKSPSKSTIATDDASDVATGESKMDDEQAPSPSRGTDHSHPLLSIGVDLEPPPLGPTEQPEASEPPDRSTVRRNLLQQMKTAATSDQYESDQYEELAHFPTTLRTYTLDNDDNVEAFATENWKEEEIYAPNRKHLIYSIAGRADAMSRSLGQLADEVRALPETLNQSVATICSTVQKSEVAAEDNRSAIIKIQTLETEVKQLGAAVGIATAMLTVNVT